MIEDRFIRGGYAPASSHAFARLLLRWPDKPISFLGEGNPVVAEMADRVHIDDSQWFYESESVADDHEFGEVSPSDSDKSFTAYCLRQPDERDSFYLYEYQCGSFEEYHGWVNGLGMVYEHLDGMHLTGSSLEDLARAVVREYPYEWPADSEWPAELRELIKAKRAERDGFKTYFVCVIRPDEEESVWEFEFQTQAELDAFRQGVEAFGTWEMHEGQWDFEEFNSMEAAIARQKELLSELDQDEQ
jgi:hypothetical protein